MHVRALLNVRTIVIAKSSARRVIYVAATGGRTEETVIAQRTTIITINNDNYRGFFFYFTFIALMRTLLASARTRFFVIGRILNFLPVSTFRRAVALDRIARS